MKLIEQIGEEMNRKAAAYSAKLQMRETRITVAAKWELSVIRARSDCTWTYWTNHFQMNW